MGLAVFVPCQGQTPYLRPLVHKSPLLSAKQMPVLSVTVNNKAKTNLPNLFMIYSFFLA
jgi:hypothetical protein